MFIAPGQRHGNYIIEKLLGQGGMAEVWSARHRLLGSRHALKVLTRTSPELTQRLLAEGRAQARLEHPHILAVRDVLHLHAQPALVIQWVSGGPAPSVRAA